MPEATTTTLDILTLVVAIVGVVLAFASLVWQGATFAWSGSRVRVKLRRGAIRRELDGILRMQGPLRPSADDKARLRKQGFIEEVLFVEVRNVGRMAVTVENVAATSADGLSYSKIADPANAALPHRLEPHSGQSWHIDLAPLQAVVNLHGQPREVWMTVDLGTGKTLRTKETTLLVPAVAHGA
jgi:hypothetical protein